jgi:AraC family transcriptional regulator
MEALSCQPERYEQGRPMLLGGLRQWHPLSELASRIPEQWRQFRSMGPVNGRLGTSAYGVMCGVTADALEYMCAVEVASFTELPEHLGRMRIHAQHYAVFRHRESVSSIKTTWERIFSWLDAAEAYESAQRPDFEVYDDSFDPRTGPGGIEIWISVSERKPKTVGS